jgi:4-alpha-glucanotransferase
VSSLNTHDFRPFAGFLKELDIDDRLKYRFIDAGDGERARIDRRDLVRRMISALVEERLLNTGNPDPEELLDAWLRRLAGGPSRFVMVNVEDLWLETRAHNVPGTPDSRPNWVARAARSLEDMEQSDRISGILKTLDGIRRTTEEHR